MFWRRPKSLDERDVAANPARLELLWLLRGEFDDALIEEMAESDQGFGRRENLEILAKILNTGELPHPMRGMPSSLCYELTPTSVDVGTPLSREARRSQLMCLLACWIMVHVHTWPESDQDGFTEDSCEKTLRNLVQSSLTLGPAFTRAAARLVSWAQAQASALHDPVDNLFYLLSLLILRCASPDEADRLAALEVYDTLVAEEHKIRRQRSADMSMSRRPGSAWLFGLYHDPYWPRTHERDWGRMAIWVLDHRRPSPAGGPDPRWADLRARFEALQTEAPGSRSIA